jgi:Ulp1 family protease
MSTEDVVIISYKSTCVYRSDTLLLEDGQWLNDILVSFWMELLEHDPQVALDTLPLPSPWCTGLVQPCSVSLHLYLEPEDLIESLRPLNLNRFERVAFPISDAGSNEHGSHWTLLLFDRLSAKLYHYDSARRMSSGRNLEVSAKFISAIWPLLRTGQDSSQLPDAPPKIEEGICGQQTNGADCGAHLLLCIERIVRMPSKTNLKDLTGGTSPTDAKNFRSRFKKVLQSFKTD